MKIATVIAFVSSVALAAPAFACPNMDHDRAETPKTAEKAPAKQQPTAKEQPKQDTAKPADTAKAKPAPAPAPSKDQPKKV